VKETEGCFRLMDDDSIGFMGLRYSHGRIGELVLLSE